MKKISVIIADDHVLFREGTRKIIEQEPDMEVIGEANDGREAIDLVTNLKPHVALLDIAMPNINGIEATRQIKEHYPNTAVLILTAYDNDQYIISLLEAGAAGYLLKNVSGSDLVTAIRAVHAGESILHPAIARKIFTRLSSSDKAPKETARPQDFSEREIEILKLAAKGMSNQDIADTLFLSRRTIQSHLVNIFRKMDIGSRTEAVLQALKRGWFSLDELV
jgi:DNA-binding NarL/FixJ family response regulator